MNAKEKILDRVRKLLALSESSNEHEAAQAAARAAELMIEHEISEASIAAEAPGEQRTQPIYDTAIDHDGKVIEWKRAIVAGLAESMGCQYYHRSSGWRWHNYKHNYKRVRVQATYQIIGTKSAIATIRYMYPLLTAEVTRLADLAYADEVAECLSSYVQPPSARGWKGAFRTGCAHRIATRLREQREQQITTARSDESKGGAIMVIDRQAAALDSFMAEKDYKFQSATSSAGSSSSSGYGAGQEAGAGVNLGGNAQLGKGTGQIGGG
jgi:hypothetical protein